MFTQTYQATGDFLQTKEKRQPEETPKNIRHVYVY